MCWQVQITRVTPSPPPPPPLPPKQPGGRRADIIDDFGGEDEEDEEEEVEAVPVKASFFAMMIPHWPLLFEKIFRFHPRAF